jgi:hypothetical protein
MELIPHHLVVHRASGGVVGPSRAGVPTQLLHGEEGLPHFGAAQEPELGLYHPKPVISLERLSYVTPHVSNPHDYVNHMFKRP